jgi:hypothetical protein
MLDISLIDGHHNVIYQFINILEYIFWVLAFLPDEVISKLNLKPKPP